VTTGRRQPVLGLAVLALAGVLAATGAVPSSAAAPAASGSPAVRHWYAQVVTVLHPLQSALVGGLQAASSWQDGTETAPAVQAEFARDLPPLRRAQGALAHLTPPKDAAAARDDYAEGVGLYVDAFQLEEAATGAAPASLVAQLQRSFERIRELGDVTFDQGTAVIAPQLGPSVAGADVVAASHIPDWPSLGLAPGEPLTASWAGPPGTPTGSPSGAAWVAAVRADRAPSQAAVRGALVGSAPAAALSNLARGLDRAEVALGSVAVPSRDARAAALLRLGLLADAEASLAADAAGQGGAASSSALRGVALSLASAGGALRSGAAAPG
jgi:hypothetical protein